MSSQPSYGPKTSTDLGSPEGRLVLLGDACHPMLVRVSSYYHDRTAVQWHVLTLSSLIVLKAPRSRSGALLSHVSSLSLVPALLQVYQYVRCVSAFLTHINHSTH